MNEERIIGLQPDWIKYLYLKKRIVLDGDCLIWLGAKAKKGYPVQHLTKTDVSLLPDYWERYFKLGNLYAATRIAFFCKYKVLPKKKAVCHSCGNVSCVNPYHLFPGLGRTKGASKLTLDAVKAIRLELSGGATQASLAEQYGVSQSAVSQIKNKGIWRDEAGRSKMEKILKGGDS